MKQPFPLLLSKQKENENQIKCEGLRSEAIYERVFNYRRTAWGAIIIAMEKPKSIFHSAKNVLRGRRRKFSLSTAQQGSTEAFILLKIVELKPLLLISDLQWHAKHYELSVMN